MVGMWLTYGCGDHRAHGRVHVARAEFVHAVEIPQTREVVVRTHHAPERGDRAMMRHQRGRLVVVIAAGARERVVLAGIHVDLDVLAILERGFDFLDRFGRNELVLLGEVQHDRALGRLVQAAFDADAIVADGDVDARAGGSQIRELAAKAEAERADFAGHFGPRAQRVHGGGDVVHALVHIEALEEVEGLFQSASV